MKDTASNLFNGVLLIVVIVSACVWFKGLPKAKYDPNMQYVYVDPLTGCQYLHLGRELTPRLDKDGKIICK